MENRASIEERFQRDWGLEPPESIFRFWEFHQSLDADERRAMHDDLWLGTAGIMDLFADPGARPRDGIDIRVHWRFYRDPPEFLTFMTGGSDGLHYGLWFEDGRTCTGVASYYSNDGGGLDTSAATPLEAVRDYLERVWFDLDDPRHGEGATEARDRLRRLRDKLTAYETADRPEVGRAYSDRYHPPVIPPVDPDRITTLDSAGALVVGETALDRPAHNGADQNKFARYVHDLFQDAEAREESVADARGRCAAGDPAEALVLGRDLHWTSGGDPVREAHAHELLVMAYRALGRSALAEIADAHHRHRDLPSVDVLADQ
ncbi:DUF2228 domain-containing protein [Actinomadura spongiicola]|uniref:DUF2228 domain-containing protein n=1 Tax=Actinomadura spongiicola TaxID=2303421 RepID=A0A372GAX4_9ACTN|nr:ADP-ribosylation family protein [Actinomadura spongiicola]RFS82302.1 DUF2228 domain-containing protein [Actinomadura spongiicola]